MRIVGGKWAGVSLVSPGSRIRPTKEGVRDAWLTGLEADLPRARILELFAGTGALGLEALSRGASSVDFVENGKASLHSLKANTTKLRVKQWTRIFKKDVFLFLATLEGPEEGEVTTPGSKPGPLYDLALADPPYTSRAAERLAALWLERPFSRILSIEHAAERTLPGRGRKRVFQDTAVTTYRFRKNTTGP